MLRPVAAVFLTACLLVILGVPAAAKNIPAFYGVLERNAPGLLEYLIPVQKTDSSAGIVMNLEAAKIEGNTAEILVSFKDNGTGDYIHGMVDMYDSYKFFTAPTYNSFDADSDRFEEEFKSVLVSEQVKYQNGEEISQEEALKLLR